MSNPTLYRARYQYPNTVRDHGRKAWITFVANSPFQAVQFAGGFVKMATKGYLLMVEEQRPLAQTEFDLI